MFAMILAPARLGRARGFALLTLPPPAQ